MMGRNFTFAVALVLCCAGLLRAQAPGPDFRPPFDGPPPFGPGGPGPGDQVRRGPGPMQPERKILQQFDKDKNERLDAAERKAAREFLAKERAEGGGRRRMGGRMREAAEPAKPGPKVSPNEVRSYAGADLYDPKIVRTIFLEFESADWEKELSDFYRTDVDVPAKLTVDGKTYREVGVHFRGASSFGMVGEGSKHSLNISVDHADKEQRVGGYRTLDLLNSHEDPSFLRFVLYSQIARNYIPAPKANFVKVVINGESWGVYVNAQHFNKDFIKENFGTTKGKRWKVPGSPNGRGTLAYLGDDPAKYKSIYEIKSKDEPAAWKELIKLCKVLNETPAEKLEATLSPILDIDGALKFLALENALVNNDGYWVRTSDYSLYQDEKGRFHVIPHDLNETFSRPGGPGFGRGRGPGGPGSPGGPPGQGPRQGGPARPVINGVELDPLIAANDSSKPLISRLLAVPALRTRYLGYVRDIAQNWLDWNKLGPIAKQYHALIADEVAADTRKLDSLEAFKNSLEGTAVTEERRGPGGGSISLKSFADQRRKYLLGYSPSAGGTTSGRE